MKTFIVITRETVVGQTVIVADNEYEARGIVISEIQKEKFYPDVSMIDRFQISKVKETK